MFANKAFLNLLQQIIMVGRHCKYAGLISTVKEYLIIIPPLCMPFAYTLDISTFTFTTAYVDDTNINKNMN